MKKIGMMLVAVFLLNLSGCQSIVTHQILHAESYPFEKALEQQLYQEFDIEKRQSCDENNTCIPYLFAPSKSHKEKIKSTYAANFTGNPFESSLHILREDTPVFDGSLVIIHGFRGSKEWMMLTATYFQFLGFEVYLVDLLGHGESQAPKGFGVKDSIHITSFVEREIPTTKPLYLLGNSMGGLAAINISKALEVKGMILQAPMIQFDQAVQGYIGNNNAWYSYFLSDSLLGDAANEALELAGVELKDTNPLSQLPTLQIPTLLFASDIDQVSPYKTYSAFESSNVKVVKVKGREHAYMSMINQSNHQSIVSWLSSISK